MSEFTDAYARLLIKQYYAQPNASAEIAAMVSNMETIRDGYAAFGDAFDLDQAIGAQLDILGAIVGIARSIPFVIDKLAFGFSDNPNARGFGDRFVEVADVAPFQDKFEPTRTALELTDADYQYFIRARIAVNIGGPYMVSDDRTSLQEVIQVLFDGLAYVIDKQDMSLALYVSPSFDTVRLQALQQLGLLPKPQGVRYSSIVQSVVGESFGFSENPDALGFGDRFDSGVVGGALATKVI